MPRRKPREAVKRSKTFTGCWTCRSRGVKCGEERPVCARCTKGSFHCEGYGVKLVWPDEYNNNPTGAQRRLFTQLQRTIGPILSESQLDISLETLDAAVVVDQEQDGLFSVFRLPSSETHISPGIVISSSDSSCSNQSNGGDGGSLFTTLPSKESCISTISGEPGENELVLDNGDRSSDISTDICRSPSRLPHTMAFTWESSMQDVIDPLGPPEYSTPLDHPAPREERELMHYWVTHLSDLMISAGLADNPYRTVWIPMALESSAGKDILLENSALLHAIYALSAFNKFQRIDSNSLPYSIRAIKHYQMSLEFLRQASMQRREAKLEAVLATISALSITEVINGNFSSWRNHLKGGRAWLQSIKRGKWTHMQKSVTYQFFLCAEAIGSVLPRTAQNKSLGNIHARAVCDSDYVHDSTFGVTSISLDTDYVLDKYFGITKPILEVIIHINHILASPYHPSKTELEGLEIKIRLNRPISALNRQASFDPESQALMDYKMMFYYACYIHFKHNLLRTASEDLQATVCQTLSHLRNIEIHEMTYGCCGILWPIFVIACESDEGKSRSAYLRWFSSKTELGIGSLSSALAVVVEVWRRRDAARVCNNGSCFVKWEEVMAEMGLDLLVV